MTLEHRNGKRVFPFLCHCEREARVFSISFFFGGKNRFVGLKEREIVTRNEEGE